MDFPRPSKSAGELFGDLKDKLGFGDGNQQGGRYEQDPYYDEYAEYADGDGYGQGYDDAYYNEEPEYTTRTRAGRTRSASSVRSASLVSSDDIRATTSAYGVSDVREGAASAYGERPSFTAAPAAGRAMVSAEEDELDGMDSPATGYSEFVSPYKERMNAASSAPVSAAETAVYSPSYQESGLAPAAPSRSSQSQFSDSMNLDSLTQPRTSSPGLDSLFTPTDSPAGASASAAEPAYSRLGQVSTDIAPHDPYTAYENNTKYRRRSARALTVIKPASYNDVQNVASVLRDGDVAILVLRHTDPALAKRILDFSFGVASALNAQVDCPTEKVFILLQGNELSLDERHRLHQQGIL